MRLRFKKKFSVKEKPKYEYELRVITHRGVTD